MIVKKAKIIETEYSDSKITTDLGVYYAHPSEFDVFDWVGEEVEILRLLRDTGGYAYVIINKEGKKVRTKTSKLTKTDYIKAHKEFLEQEFDDLVEKIISLNKHKN